MFRTLAVRGVIVLAGAAGISAAASVAMPSAFADNVYYSTLDVTPPSVGSIDSVDSNFNQIHCGPDAPGPCSITDQQSELGERPTTGWYTYQLQASGGGEGYSWKWTSGCSGMTPTCTITNDQEFTSVSGEWIDTERPVMTGLTMPTSSNLPLQVAAVGTDNSGVIDHFNWLVCATGGACLPMMTAPPGYFSIPDLADGVYTVSAQPVDAAGNAGFLNGRQVTIDTEPAVVTITSPHERQQVDAYQPWLRFTANEWVGTSCAIDGGTPFLCWDGFHLPELANGPHSLGIIAYDQANNISVTVRHFTVVDPKVTAVGTPESVYGDPASITVQVPRLSNAAQVVFTDPSTGAELCNKSAPLSGKVTCRFSGVHFRPGVHDIAVTFTGGTWHHPAAATIPYTVDRKPATMTVAPQQGQYGAPYPVTVTGLPNNATGTVEFAVGETPLCTAHVHHGVATCSVPGRKLAASDTAYRVTAAYSGDDLYAGIARTFRLTVHVA